MVPSRLGDEHTLLVNITDAVALHPIPTEEELKLLLIGCDAKLPVAVNVTAPPLHTVLLLPVNVAVHA